MNHKDRQTLARLYREFFRPRTGLFVLAFFLLVLSSGLAFAQVRLLEPAFDLLLVAGNEAYLLLIPAAMILIGVFKGLVGYTNLLVGARINGSITRQLQQRMFDAVVKADLAWLRREASGQMLARFNEIGAINSIVNGVFTSAVRNTLLIIAYVGNLIYTNWQLALLSLVIIPLAIFPVLSLGRRARKVSKQQLEVGAKFLAFLDENIKGVIQIRLYGIEEQKRQDARDRFRHLYKLGIRATMISGRLLPLMEALTGIAIG
ncbi:MAG: hypothetical protein K0U36_01850, partial [Alphaproteobacteria bacterium]|nr:hypothetical protein [Alphaproteobacteria bacterium]